MATLEDVEESLPVLSLNSLSSPGTPGDQPHVALHGHPHGICSRLLCLSAPLLPTETDLSCGFGQLREGSVHLGSSFSTGPASGKSPEVVVEGSSGREQPLTDPREQDPGHVSSSIS